ncbi:MAG: hypothetical protein Q9159_006056 [Coniocarpon cinnabarinum]
MSQSAKQAPVLRLPIEILERVFTYLVPCDEERYWNSAEPVPEHVLRWYYKWKTSAFAARLACQYFSQSTILKRAIFHTIYWFPTNRNLESMKSIVEHYPEMVKCFSWYSPLYGYGEVDEHTYLGQLDDDDDEDDEAFSLWSRRFKDAKETFDQLGRCRLVLAEFCSTYPEIAKAVHFVYVNVFRVQGSKQQRRHTEFILRSEHTTVKLAQAFRSLPNLCKFIYNGVCSETSKILPKDLAAPSRHSLLEGKVGCLKWNGESLLDVCDGDYVGAYGKVVNAMWACGTKPLDFAISRDAGHDDTVSTFRHIPDVREMRQLSLAPPSFVYQTKWMHALVRNAPLCRNLRELRLSHSSRVDFIADCLPQMSKLESLWLCSLELPSYTMMTLLRDVAQLSHLKLQDLSLLMNDDSGEAWPEVFQIIRRFRIHSCEIFDLWKVEHDDEDEGKGYLNSACLEEPEEVEVRDQLYKFLKGQGEWTKPLQVAFSD